MKSLLFLALFVTCISAWKQFGPNFQLVQELEEKHLQQKLVNQRECLRPQSPLFNNVIRNQCLTRLAPPPEPALDVIGPWASVSIKGHHDSLYRRVFKLILDKGLFYNEATSRKESPFNFTSPEDLYNEIDFSLGEEPDSEDNLVKLLEGVIDLSPHASHPYHLHRRTAGLDPYGIAADWMEATMSSNMLTYLFSNAFTLMEYELNKEIRKLVYDPVEGKGDGVGTPIPNAMALQLAMQSKFPKWKKMGWSETQNVAIFISEHADYSTIKSANIEGAGFESVYTVKTDKNGRMDLNSLKETIEKAKKDGREPLMIIGTAGTPILGAIDDLDGIGNIAKENGLWFHCDAGCGGSLLMSETKRSLLKGIEKSDSFSWMPSCLLGVPYITGMIFTKKENIFRPTFTSAANAYVHQDNGFYNVSVDLGEKTIQTCRRPDVFKLWFMWKAKGLNGLGEHIDYIYSMTQFLTQEIGKRSSFKLILDKFDTPFVSFFYIPSQLMGKDQNLPEVINQLNTATDQLKNEMLNRGIAQTYISTSISGLSGTPNFFTFNLGNSALTQSDLKYILDQMEHIGKGSIGEAPKVPECPQEFPDFVSAPIRSKHGAFLKDLLELNLEKGIYFQDKRRDPPLRFRTPDELSVEFDFSLGKSGIQDDQELLKIMDDVIKYSYHQAHPYWLYQLLAGLDPMSIIADMVLGTVSSPQLTYEDNPIFTIAEREVVKGINKRIGWEDGEGLFAEGGSFANMIGVKLAIQKKFPESKISGIKQLGKRLVYYTSIDAHYSQILGAFVHGLGSENCVYVATERFGRMDPQKLRAAIEKTISEGGVPFMVGTTSGTTILGAFDNIQLIADICEEYKLWLHVDGAFGGSVIMSDNPKHRNLLKGLERADSFSFNPTKVFGSTLISNCFVVKHKGLLQETYGASCPIDFDKTTTLYDKSNWDNGDAHMENIRRANVFKFFLMWKGKGTKGLTKHINYVMENTKYCVEEMSRRDGFTLFLSEFEITNVVFMYIPKSMRAMDQNTKEFKEKMERIGKEIQARLVLDGIMVIVVQHEQDSPLQLKLVLFSSGVTKQDIKYVIDQIEAYGKFLN